MDENCEAELNGAESLHEMSTRQARRQKRQFKKRKEVTIEEKISRTKLLLRPFPGMIFPSFYTENCIYVVNMC